MSKIAKESRAERLRALTRGMRLPLIAAPMFLVSGPGLVLAACRAGIAAAFPTPEAKHADATTATTNARATVFTFPHFDVQ